jgi:hypothetical protein
VNIIAGAIAFIKVGRPSLTQYAGRMRRPRHEQLLWQFRLLPSLRLDPMELAFRTILLGQVPRWLQAPVGTQQSLLEMAL